MKESDLTRHLKTVAARDDLRERAAAMRNATEVRVACYSGEYAPLEFELDEHMPGEDPLELMPNFAKEIREAVARVMDQRAMTLQKLLDAAGIEE